MISFVSLPQLPMFLIYLGVYVLFSLLIWGFFGVAWIHAHKFKDFSTHIVPVSRMLLVFLLVITVIGLFLILSLSSKQNSFSLEKAQDIPIQNQNYY